MIAGVLRSNARLTSVDLSDNALCGLGTLFFGQSGRERGYGGQVGSNSNTFGNACGRGLEALGRAVRMAPQLKELSLADNQLGRYSVRSVAAFLTSLQRHPGLERLDLSRNCIGPTGSNTYDVKAMVALGDLLAPRVSPDADLRPDPNFGRPPPGPLPSWEIAQDDGGGGGSGGGEDASERSGQDRHNLILQPAHARTYCCLRILNLSGNEIPGSGVSFIADALARNSSVRVLDLSHNEIAAAGMKALNSMLINNATLTRLDVSRNGVIAAGGDQYVTFAEKELGCRVERSTAYLEAIARESQSKEDRKNNWKKQKALVPAHELVDAIDAKLVLFR
jgi:hypothetical protein